LLLLAALFSIFWAICYVCPGKPGILACWLRKYSLATLACNR